MASPKLISRIHIMNSCLYQKGKYSCAVDYFLEICHGVLMPHLVSTNRNPVFDKIIKVGQQLENL